MVWASRIAQFSLISRKKLRSSLCFGCIDFDTRCSDELGEPERGKNLTTQTEVKLNFLIHQKVQFLGDKEGNCVHVDKSILVYRWLVFLMYGFWHLVVCWMGRMQELPEPFNTNKGIIWLFEFQNILFLLVSLSMKPKMHHLTWGTSAYLQSWVTA